VGSTVILSLLCYRDILLPLLLLSQQSRW